MPSDLDWLILGMVYCALVAAVCIVAIKVFA